MIQTFSYKTETLNKSYQHIVHSTDIKSSIEKWITKIEDLQNQSYSFNNAHAQHIKQQFLDGQLNINIDKEPWFLTYKIANDIQIVKIDKINKGLPDLVGRVTYLTTQEGGRIGYAISGYRPAIKFEGKNDLTSGEQLFIEKDKVFPGDTVTAEIRIIAKEIFKNFLFVGQSFEITEGIKRVGQGEIIEIINQDLKQASR